MDVFKNLIRWYHKNKRDLPWRRTSDPYKIWVSEIILQQTRVDQGMEYYIRIINRYPDVNALANAAEDEVLKTWQGLGYYSRARNMLLSAREIENKHSGHFPENYCDIRNLKGIGDYTAAAIASIAFNLPYPVVDGNVLRVISRLEGITDPIDSASTKKYILNLLEEKIDKKLPGDFNQALMELGALICTPSNPRCIICPLNVHCNAYHTGRIKQIPVKTKKQAKKIRYFEYFIILVREDNKWFTFLEKRSGEDIWKGLYQFPLIETKSLLQNPIEEFFSRNKGFIRPDDILEQYTSKMISHILTHRIIKARFQMLLLESADEEFYEGFKVDYKKLFSYPFPRLTDRYLKVFVEKFEKKFV